jgi:hypothetical protein
LELSPKGKIPWITLNGEHVSDSQFCIDFMIKKFNKDLSAHLGPADKAVVHSFLKMTEESLRWCMAYHRFFVGKASDIAMPGFVFKIVGDKLRKEIVAQGYGRHSTDEGFFQIFFQLLISIYITYGLCFFMQNLQVYQIGFEDLRSLNEFIGGKKYLMGEKVCNEDASIFGNLVQIIYFNTDSPLCQFLKSMSNFSFESIRFIVLK